jgi:hypothetical protein
VIGVVAAVAVLALGGAIFVGATQKAYACESLFQPAAAASPAASGAPTAGLGELQPDMGNNHVAVGTKARYPLCPPASGPHYSDATGGNGPIQPRYYGQDDAAVPEGWIHNLEHGALVVLYSCAQGGCTSDSQAQLQAFLSSFPNSPVCNSPKGTVGPVIARFDDMKTPFAALVWGRVLFQDRLDTAAILDFFKAEGERTNPEPQCPRPTASPSPTSPSPSGAPSPSPS